MTLQFPDQFGGIELAVVARTAEELKQMVNTIIGTPKKDGGCGHRHNFAVDPSNKRLYVSALGMKCVTEAASREFRPPAPSRPWRVR